MLFRERLWPSAGVLLAASLSFPMLLLAALPFGPQVGFMAAFVGSVGLVTLLFATAPTISLDSHLKVGRMRIPIEALAETQTLDKEALKKLIGPEADVRAQLFIRGYIKAGIKIAISDATDPTPYVVISTRKPKELAVALLANRS
ncbi:unannotated protein [freshwater metagenome]|uniref:Unannotated protein n=1 Tax=freshwater metagenome TaxID=449393 RepID=A0A6J6E0B7_9ZZZZ|nr:DUF3093 family protein [Actinomycetota bacterium]